MNMENIFELKNIIDQAENIVFFGGAGVSTASGIPDFRSSKGLYNTSDTDDAPEAILSSAYLYENSRKFFEYYRSNMVYPYAEPNDAHFALAELERQGKLSCVITQNIDGLHQAAGSKNVIELHGSVHRNYCVRCGKFHDLSHIINSDGIARCTACGAMVRPDVVLYGESLNNEALTKAEDAIYEADLLIVGGTSLNVFPAASLVLDYIGEHLVIINQTPTRFDAYAELVLRDPICEVMSSLVN